MGIIIHFNASTMRKIEDQADGSIKVTNVETGKVERHDGKREKANVASQLEKQEDSSHTTKPKASSKKK